MLLETISEPYQQPMTTDYASTFPTIAPTATEPKRSATRWILELGGQCAQNAILILPYGTGSDLATFKLRAYSWSWLGDDITGSGVNSRLWMPVPMFAYTCTIDASSPGVTGTLAVATKLFCKTLALTLGNEGVSVETMSTGTAGLISHIHANLKGSKKIELTFDTNSSATGCNALARKV